MRHSTSTNLQEGDFELKSYSTKLEALGNIGPRPIDDYTATKFDVNDQGFDIAVPISEELQSEDVSLLFVVWSSEGEDIGAACVKWP